MHVAMQTCAQSLTLASHLVASLLLFEEPAATPPSLVDALAPL